MSEEITNSQSEAEESSVADTPTEPVESATQATEPTEQPTEATEPPLEQPKTEEEAAEILTAKGFEYKKLQTEFEQHGDITPETRAELAKVGITDEFIDTFIEGRYAVVQQQMADITASIGGQEEFDAITNWARANLSKEEKMAIDEVHNPILIKGILRDLKARMQEKDGYLPQQITGNSMTTPADLFESMAEVGEAIRDPRYAKDEAYRDKVTKKITASREAGKISF